MHKPPLAHINARMGDAAALGKKNHITGPKRLWRDWRAPELEFGHRAWRQQPGAGAVHMGNQTAAVKTTLRGIATITVRGAHQADRIQGDIARLLRR